MRIHHFCRASIKSLALVLFTMFLSSHKASAIQLDWSGQYWFENQWLNNYQLDRSRPSYDNDPALKNSGGPYVPGAGERNVVWYSSFLRLKPKVVVNDSVNIKSEWHVGSPIYGFMGRGYPGTTDESLNFSNSSKQSSTISAQRYWANLITDFGTIELGRAPIHWGLGAIWNSGDQLFDHYQSSGDMVRLTSKFGNFWIIPSINKVAMGSHLAGATDSAGNTIEGDDDVSDLNIAAKYDNPEEDFEFGVMWTRRSGSVTQSTVAFNSLGTSGASTGSNRIAYNIYDFYAKKRLGRYSFGAEFPLLTGNLGAIDGVKEFEYKAWALILEGKYTSDIWDIDLKAGHVPGQPNGDADSTQTAGSLATSAGDTTFRTVYLNKDYGLGLIMFHYNIYGLANNNPDNISTSSLNSPYNAPIVNANYLALTPQLKLDKWTMKWSVIAAWATQSAQSGKNFFNYNSRKFYNARANQDKFLGKEFDFGLSFKWDENVVLSWDTGLWFPGGYYAFTNHPLFNEFDLSFMYASQLRLGINF